MRILFMGTPDFAVASLKRLVADGHDICGVFTQPDKPKNRGMKLIAPPVKEYALTQGLHVYQPLKMKDGTALELVRSLAPELIVVAAYGRILPEDILNTPKYGAINVHSSILPKYRGAAPINWAILNGDTVTGVSIMYMAPELDAGDVILCRETAIDPDEDAVALTARLAQRRCMRPSGRSNAAPLPGRRRITRRTPTRPCWIKASRRWISPGRRSSCTIRCGAWCPGPVRPWCWQASRSRSTAPR